MLEPKYIVKFGEKVPNEALAGAGEIALNVSEFFYDTIQGEGVNVGQPAAFLRLAGCPVNCKFCDTAQVWKTSQRIKVSWIIEKLRETGLGKKFVDNEEIFVITGGSPLLQQDALVDLFESFLTIFQKLPWIEVENECSLVAGDKIKRYVSLWNNSPKLSNSEVPEERRYRPEALLSVVHENSVYKFVVRDELDWNEIQEKYIDPKYVQKSRIMLMPMGGDQKEYFENREKVVELAIKHGVRYSPREHIAIWNKKTGI